MDQAAPANAPPSGAAARSLPRIDSRELLAVFAGGVVGAVCRVAVVRALAPHPSAWPWATFAVNIGGTFLLGWLVTRLQERLPLSAYRRPFLGTGVCGALTTFSTMQLELLRLIDAGRYGLACGYAAASVGTGFVAVALGTALARRARLV